MKKENVEYVFTSIGEFCMIGSKSVISIKKDYRKGLTHLDKFSHAIVIYLSENCFKHRIVKIERIDNEAGNIYLHENVSESGTLFDIKPYFPIEDRVQNAGLPQTISKALYYNRLKETEDDKYRLSPLGMIRKIENDYYLYINQDANISLEELQGATHLRVFWWFHRFDSMKYRIVQEVNPPYENAPRTGVFASRSPVRPNPIAMTTVEIQGWDLNNNRIKVSEMDCFDKTPLIDIAAYVPENDRVDNFFVPKWLNHWPKWFVVNQANNNITVSKQSGVEVLARYLKTETDDYAFSFNERTGEHETNNTHIQIRGARQNNLKNINVNIPYGKITVVTGVSGSGKSSLVFDTLFAESQRRFLDSMAVSERSSFEQQEKPDIDDITGLPPAIAISQKSIGRNPRSTVATITDMNNYLSLLFSSIGTRSCPSCGNPITPLSEKEIRDLLSSLKEEIDVSITPNGLQQPEYTYKTQAKKMSAQNLHLLLLSGKGAIDVTINHKETFTLQTTQKCYECDRVLFELTPATFSFNNPESMCPVCKGLGVKMDVDANKIITNPELSILAGASPFWSDLRKFRENPNANRMKGELLGLAESMEVDLETPWNLLADEFKKQALYGSEGKEITFSYTNSRNGRSGKTTCAVEGAVNIIKRLFAECSGDRAKSIADTFMTQAECDCCRGERLSAEGRFVQIAGTRFPEVLAKNMEDLKLWIEQLPMLLSRNHFDIASPILRELHRHLDNYIRIGIPYLSLNRSTPTLSGGELQRIKLANQLSSGISNILYVLDEPSAGLHSKDHEKLMSIIDQLKALGNTVVIVEHNKGIMKRADYLIDIGPKAGVNGGFLVADGTPQEVMENTTSETGLYLSGRNNVEVKSSFDLSNPHWITVTGLVKNNLKNIDISFPQGAVTCITGVSGSGKSSLISVLHPAIKNHIENKQTENVFYSTLIGIDDIRNIINVTQQPIGRTPRSNPATYTGLMDEIRNVFATTEEAKKKGYKSSLFSFNSKDGQCPVCKGNGRKCLEVHFMPDIWMLCPSCKGKRFNEIALEITFNGKNISDVLEMNVDEALGFFPEKKKINNILSVLSEIGLGYLKLGQSALTLSGGEAQRIKLAKELAVNVNGKTIYLLDEPTSGLHFSDIQNLLKMLRKIADTGDTIIIVEHNINMIRNSDWIIDLGPEGGEHGGNLVAQGTPTSIIKNKDSYTVQEMIKQ